MDWRILELMTTALLVVIIIVLGPFIKRFGKSYAAEVFRANPGTGKSFIVLMDFAYYLVFGAYVLFTPVLNRPETWSAVVNGVQLKPGEYSVAFNDGSAVFYRDGKEVAKAAARTEAATAKFSTNSLLYLSDEKTLSEIRLGGTSQKVVLDGVTAAKSGSSKSSPGTQR